MMHSDLIILARPARFNDTPVTAVRFKWSHRVLEATYWNQDQTGTYVSRHSGLFFDRRERRQFFDMLRNHL